MELLLFLLEAKVKKTFKGSDFKLECEIADQGFICLTGPNGSGKSTLLGIIAGTIKADEGHVKLNSKEVTNFPIERRGIVLVTSESFIPNMRVAKHLVWSTTRKRTLESGYVERVRAAILKDIPDELVGKLSLGTRVKVALATALISKPQAILIDEAFSNLDNRREFIQTYRLLTIEARIDLIFSTQNKLDADLADHHYAMEHGSANKIF
jgi:molybdate/tungstate transport system ATP-binding protein